MNYDIELAVSPEKIIADGASTSLVTVTFTNSDSKDIGNVSVTLTTTKGKLSYGGEFKDEIKVFTNDAGVATVTLQSSTTAGDAEIKATNPKAASGYKTVEFLSGAANSFELAVDDIFREDELDVEISNALDENDNLLNGTYTGTITISNSGDIYTNTFSSTEIVDGKYTYTITNLTDIPGSYTAKVTIDDHTEEVDFEILQPVVQFAFNETIAEEPGEAFSFSQGESIVVSLETISVGTSSFTIKGELTGPVSKTIN